MKRARWIAIAAAACLALPSSALAATSSTDSTVDSTAGAELSLAASLPSVMTLTHATAGTTTSIIDVTSTSAAWTLSISDKGLTTPGYMDKVDCVTKAPLTGSLANPLQWSPDGSTFSNLSSTAATVATGSLVDAKTVTFKQPLGSSEDVTVGDCYRLTVTYTVTDS